MSKAAIQANSTSGTAASAGPSSSSSSSSSAGGSTSPANVLHVQPEKPQHYTAAAVRFGAETARSTTVRTSTAPNTTRAREPAPMETILCLCVRCPFLHRTAGDTERRYHLRYYKTGSCIHETDSKGHCSKNGPHCAFAHGSHDLRSPVYDIREVQMIEAQAGTGGMEGASGDGQSGLAASTALIEKILAEEPSWQDNNYVLSHYKTELCKKPPRLCRQGYACPYYHNSKDRRRSPHKLKYRALPCPAVKHSDEWGDPSKCESGESCQYCHTRTEQQFHPEIYKSTKCNDMQQSGTCPRGPFCAFAHLEHPSINEEIQQVFLNPSSPLPSGTMMEDTGQGSPGSPQGCIGGAPFAPPSGACIPEQGLRGRLLGEDSPSLDAPLTPWVGDGGYGRAPGFEREDQAKQKTISMEHRSRETTHIHSKQDLMVFLPVGSPLSMSSSVPSSLAATPPSPAPPGPSPGMNANALPFYPTSDTVESVVESALDDLDLNDFGMSALEKSLDSSTAAPIQGGSQLQSSAPVNIPGSFSSSAPFRSPSPSPPVRALTSPFLSAHLPQPGQSEGSFLGPSHSSLGLNGMSCSIWEHLPPAQGSPGTPPTLHPSGLCMEATRLKQEVEDANRVLKHWDHSWRQMAQSWAIMKADAEESRVLASRLTLEAERAQRGEEEAQRQASLLEEALESLQNAENPHLSLHQLQLLHRLPLEAVCSLQAQLCTCLHTVEQAVFRKQRLCCAICGELGSVTLPCQHGLLCEGCASSSECPACAEHQQALGLPS
ncbi:RING finger protein unkempt homolog isoform X2 [Brienomyrus brachyistius]|uniref:RING finger protein unkempt homolog isoform X2 n=2 Tax=Brienomyrus brachyistius TaxID=42636 RepID=UPI0020B18BCB|nr:RING finger protein unkempt homolog isoform X2 [Brienomyrus brachyistius]